METETLTREQLARMFDHTFLKAYATKEDFIKLCKEAKEINAAMVAINSAPVSFCNQFMLEPQFHFL